MANFKTDYDSIRLFQYNCRRKGFLNNHLTTAFYYIYKDSKPSNLFLYYKTMRLFTAITLPDNIKEMLSRFSHGVRNCKWVDTENLHLTLTFTEEYNDTAFLIDTLLQCEAEKFSLSLEGCGFFPCRDRGTLWAGVTISSGLTTLHEEISSLLKSNQIPFDKKEFKPHITLGRIKGRYNEKELRSFLENALYLHSEPFHISDFTLFSSQLTPDGPLYSEEGRFALL